MTEVYEICEWFECIFYLCGMIPHILTGCNGDDISNLVARDYLKQQIKEIFYYS